MTNIDVGGAVLAGGASRRMGRDKAAIEIDGRAMARIALDALLGAGIERCIVVGGGSGYGFPLVADLHPGEGPLGGLIAGLAATDASRLVVLPCDLPWVGAEEIRLLLSGDDDSLDVVFGAVRGEMAAPIGVWHQSARATLEEVFDTGERSFRGALSALRHGTVELGDRARDVDRPAELPIAGSLPAHHGSVERTRMIPEIDVEELEVRLEKGVALIDVREVDEYAEAHVPGARLLPLSELEGRIEDLSPDEVLMLICRSGARSMRAAEVLAGRGMDVTNVAGGTMAWMASGRDIATGMERG